jgi:hypothetical protein
MEASSSWGDNMNSHELLSLFRENHPSGQYEGTSDTNHLFYATGSWYMWDEETEEFIELTDY